MYTSSHTGISYNKITHGHTKTPGVTSTQTKGVKLSLNQEREKLGFDGFIR